MTTTDNLANLKAASTACLARRRPGVNIWILDQHWFLPITTPGFNLRAHMFGPISADLTLPPPEVLENFYEIVWKSFRNIEFYRYICIRFQEIDKAMLLFSSSATNIKKFDHVIQIVVRP
jgi:hypothetical protein